MVCPQEHMNGKKWPFTDVVGQNQTRSPKARVTDNICVVRNYSLMLKSEGFGVNGMVKSGAEHLCVGLIWACLSKNGKRLYTPDINACHRSRFCFCFRKSHSIAYQG